MSVSNYKNLDINEYNKMIEVFLRKISDNTVSEDQLADSIPLPEGGPYFIEANAPEWMWVKEMTVEGIKEYPVYKCKQAYERIEAYFQLVDRFPELFRQDNDIPICFDRKEMVRFEENSEKKIGLLYDNTRYWMIVSDLIGTKEPYYSYVRIVYHNESNGTVIIPCLENENGNVLFGVLDNFRHAGRKQYKEFPRGYMASRIITGKENALKELNEELGVTLDSVTDIRYMGKMNSDTALSPGQVDIYLVKMKGAVPPANIGHEGIKNSYWYTASQLKDMIAKEEITDSFTIGALMHYLLKV